MGLNIQWCKERFSAYAPMVYRGYSALIPVLAFVLPLSETGMQVVIGLLLLMGLYLSACKKIVIRFDPPTICFTMLLAALLVGAFLVRDTAFSLRSFYAVVRLYVVFLAVRSIRWERKLVNRVLACLFVGFLLTLFWGYFNYFNGEQYLELNSVGHVNHSSIYILLVGLTAAFILIFDGATLPKPLFICALLTAGCSFFSVFFSGSRATTYSLLLLLAGAGCYAAFKAKTRLLLVMTFLFLVAAICFQYGIGKEAAERLMKGAYFHDRMGLVIGFFRSWLDSNLLFGIGLGNSRLVELHSYYPESILARSSHAHNTYLAFLVEQGLVGLGCYLLFLVLVLVRLLQQFTVRRGGLIAAGIALWAANFIISFANTTFHHENAVLLLMIWGMALASEPAAALPSAQLTSDRHR
jgi:O-antigen ligase